MSNPVPESNPASVTTDTKDNPGVFDPAVLGAFLGEDNNAIASVLRTFLTSMEENMGALDKALDQQKWASLADIAHRIKGAALMSGAPAMAAAAQALEGVSRAQDTHASSLVAAQVQTHWKLLQLDPVLHATLSRAQATGGPLTHGPVLM